jgi:hypothetical protein
MQRNSLGDIRKIPGPGSYTHREFIGNEAPKFTLTGKPKTPQSNPHTSVPGPNAYGSMQAIQSKSAAYGYLEVITLKVWKGTEK